jgi:hypothetical protein
LVATVLYGKLSAKFRKIRSKVGDFDQLRRPGKR